MKHIDVNSIFTKLGGVFKALEQSFDTLAHQKQTEVLAVSMTREIAMKNTQFLSHRCAWYFVLQGRTP